jgi:hypothetical protein
MIVVDLRELTGVDAAAPALSVQAREDCGTRCEPRLLLSDDVGDHPLAYAPNAAGLGGQPRFPCQQAQPAPRTA